MRHNRWRRNLPLILVLWLTTACGGGTYLETRRSGCQIFDPHPQDGQVLDWDGGCSDGYASGYGTLVATENGAETLRCQGSVQHGRFQGIVVMSIIRDDNVYTSYEDEWQAGVPIRRIRNVSLASYLEPATDARSYLHRLKQFRQRHPDAWIDDFHDVLAQKTFFVCRAAAAPGPSSSASERREGGDATKVLAENELLIKIAADGHPGDGYYTVYNHRIESLKNLVSDRYRPGGDQIHANLDLAVCSDPVPADLPESRSLPEERHQLHGDLVPPAVAGAHWYPIKRY